MQSTDSESDEIEPAEIEKRKPIRAEAAAQNPESVAIQTQMLHLQVGSGAGNKHWMSDRSSQTSHAPASGDDSDSVPADVILMRDRAHSASTRKVAGAISVSSELSRRDSAITREIADGMSAEELDRRKSEIQEQ